MFIKYLIFGFYIKFQINNDYETTVITYNHEIIIMRIYLYV